MTVDQIMEEINAIAGDPDNRDQFKALKMLAAEKSSAVVLPDPLSDREVIDRMVRIVKPFGKEIWNIVGREAFEGRRSTADMYDKIKTRSEHLTLEQLEKIGRIRNVRDLYRQIPELKRDGVPKGYPKSKGEIVQQAWLRERATAHFIAVNNDRMNEPEKSKDETPVGEQGGDVAPPGSLP